MQEDLSISQKFLVRFGVILLILVVSGSPTLVASNTPSGDTNMKHQPIVEELIRILGVKPGGGKPSSWFLQKRFLKN